MKPNETGWKPGIVKLRDTALSERRIERLGPPPGKAGHLNQPATGFPPPPQQRNVSGFNLGSFQGYGAVGRLGWITELQPYLRGPDDRRNGRVPALGSMPFDSAWRLIDRAYQLTLREEDAEANARIQYFWRAFGLLGTLIEVYNPIWRAWALVEP